METDSREFGLFLDGLRIERNISREDLCEGIMSLSQYKRYLRGDTAIPNDRLVLIADRLKFSISDLHFMYRNKSDKQYNDINNIYELILSHNYNDAYEKAIKFRNTGILTAFNQQYFDFCFIYVQYKLGMVSNVHVLELYSRMIDYPDCLNKNSFNWVEMNVLLQIIIISSSMDNYEPSEIMYKILVSEEFNYTMSKDVKLLPNVYLTLAQILGKQKEYKKVIEITKLGIEHCRKFQVFSALALLFLIKSFAHLDLGDNLSAMENAKLAFMQLQIEDKPHKLDQYKHVFENRFGLELADLMNN